MSEPRRVKCLIFQAWIASAPDFLAPTGKGNMPIALRAFHENSNSLEILGRMESRFSRASIRAQNLLHELRRAKAVGRAEGRRDNGQNRQQILTNEPRNSLKIQAGLSAKHKKPHFRSVESYPLFQTIQPVISNASPRHQCLPEKPNRRKPAPNRFYN
jgi:hypothetical protein